MMIKFSFAGLASLFVIFVSIGSAFGQESDRSQETWRVQAFYYPWYGNPEHDGRWVHWQQGGHTPPQQLGAQHYPALGPYSSADPAVLTQHMQWMQDARIGVAVVSWWGPQSLEDQRLDPIFAAAEQAGMAVAFHLEPYQADGPEQYVDDLIELLDRYEDHAALFRDPARNMKPLVYVFECLHHEAELWSAALARLREHHEVLMIGQTTDLAYLIEATFDGGYSYDLLPWFNDRHAWAQQDRQRLKQFAESGLLYIPSIGPGYWDDRATYGGANEPANAQTRDDGQDTTYRFAWREMAEMQPDFVSITSFNEWHEGSQIEPAVAKSFPGVTYPGYSQGPEFYLNLTAEKVDAYLSP